tara:strand:- start:96058 stop:97572 length:1515 start_codon:yes stop_codon:yes gene_type:complete
MFYSSNPKPTQTCVYYSDKPLGQPGTAACQITIDNLKQRIEEPNFQYTESVAVHRSLQAQTLFIPSRSIPQDVSAYVNAPKTEKLAICKIDETVGHGVYANEAIEANEIVAHYAGELQMITPQHERNGYALQVPSANEQQILVIDAKRQGGIARFFQHLPNEKKTNTTHDLWRYPTGIRPENMPATENLKKECYYLTNNKAVIIFRTSRRIEQHEQLGFDYDNEYWNQTSITPLAFAKKGGGLLNKANYKQNAMWINISNFADSIYKQHTFYHFTKDDFSHLVFKKHFPLIQLLPGARPISSYRLIMQLVENNVLYETHGPQPLTDFPTQLKNQLPTSFTVTVLHLRPKASNPNDNKKVVVCHTSIPNDWYTLNRLIHEFGHGLLDVTQCYDFTAPREITFYDLEKNHSLFMRFITYLNARQVKFNDQTKLPPTPEEKDKRCIWLSRNDGSYYAVDIQSIPSVPGKHGPKYDAKTEKQDLALRDMMQLNQKRHEMNQSNKLLCI